MNYKDPILRQVHKILLRNVIFVTMISCLWFEIIEFTKISTINHDSDDLSWGKNYLWYLREDDNTIYENAVNFAEKH